MSDEKNKLSILFVDDEGYFLTPLERIFKRHYKVYTATDATQALDIVRRFPIHIVASDQTMPGVTGMELLQNIKEISPHTVRILVAEADTIGNIEKSAKEGAVFRFIEKPWETDKLKETISLAADVASYFQRSDPLTAIDISTTDGPNRFRGIMAITHDAALCETIYDSYGESNVIFHAETSEQALDIIKKQEIIAAVVDTAITGIDVEVFLGFVKKTRPAMLTVLVAGQNESGLVARLTGNGQVFRCLTRPARSVSLKLALNSAFNQYQNQSSKGQTKPSAQVENGSKTGKMSWLKSKLGSSQRSPKPA